MRRIGIFLSVIMLAAVCGCSLPRWQIFQKKVDGKLAEKPAEQVEAERRGAKFIEKKSATVEQDPVRQLAAIHAIATPLSASLGEPKHEVTVADFDKIVSELRAGKLAEQKRADEWKAFAKKYAGKPLEDTGFNVAGPAGIFVIIAIIALCITFPGFGYLLLRVVPQLWGTLRRVTSGIEFFAAAHPDAAETLKDKLSKRMDEAHKKLVARMTKKPMPAL